MEAAPSPRVLSDISAPSDLKFDQGIVFHFDTRHVLSICTFSHLQFRGIVGCVLLKWARLTHFFARRGLAVDSYWSFLMRC